MGPEFCFTSTCSMNRCCFSSPRSRTRNLRVVLLLLLPARLQIPRGQPSPFIHLPPKRLCCAFCRRCWQESRQGARDPVKENSLIIQHNFCKPKRRSVQAYLRSTHIVGSIGLTIPNIKDMSLIFWRQGKHG